MRWTSLPKWLKGALIGGLIGLYNYLSPTLFHSTLMFSIIFFTLFGALIGWIFDKTGLEIGFKNLSKGALIGGIIGVCGVIFSSIFFLDNGYTLFNSRIIEMALMPFLIIGLIFTLIGCNWKQSSCGLESLAGSIVTIILFSLIGALIERIVNKLNSRGK